MRLQSVLGREPIGIATGIAVTATLYAGAGVSTKSEREDRTQELRQTIDSRRAKNVILLSGTAWGTRKSRLRGITRSAPADGCGWTLSR